LTYIKPRGPICVNELFYLLRRRTLPALDLIQSPADGLMRPGFGVIMTE
jgi:hypothetical protein